MSAVAPGPEPLFGARTYYNAPALLLACVGPVVLFLEGLGRRPHTWRRFSAQLKFLTTLCLFASELTLAIVASEVTAFDEFYLVTVCMPSIAALVAALDAYHRRRTPIVLDIYSSLFLLADLVRALDHWLQHGWSLVSIVSGSAVLFNAARIFWVTLCNVHEAIHQRRVQIVSNEALRDGISMFLFFGFRNFRSTEDLPDFGHGFTLQHLSNQFDIAWANTNKESKHALLKTLSRVLLWPLLAMIPPRLCLSFCQLNSVLLMRRVIAFTAMDASSKDDSALSIISAMIGSSIVLSISALWGQYMQDYFDALVHGLLSSITWKKALQISPEDASRFEVTGTIRTQIERLTTNLHEFHATWLAPFEIAMNLYFFYSFEGSRCFFILPSLTIATIITYFIGKGTTKVIMRSGENSGQLIAQTSRIVSDARGVKMLALEEQVMSYLEPFQAADVEANKDLYFYQFLSMAALVFVADIPALSVVAAGIFWTGSITEMKATPTFHLMAFIALILDPSVALMRDTPRMEVRAAALRVIQEFLLIEDVQDERVLADVLLVDGIQRHSRRISPTAANGTIPPNVLEFREVSITPGHSEEPLLSGLDFSVQRRQRVAVTGPVGSGKTLMLKAMTGSVAASRGSVCLKRSDSSVAYCGQRIWLDDASIRSNVTKGTVYHHQRYKRIIRACLLDDDIEKLPGLDKYRIGINGTNLSGGQRQRLALARTLYCEPSIVIVDDILSGLDKKTASLIFNRVLGPKGLLAQDRTTTIFVTNSESLISQFDRAIFIDKYHRVDVANDKDEIQQVLNRKIASGEMAKDREVGHTINDDIFPSDIPDSNIIRQVQPVAAPVRGKRDTSLNFFLVKSVPKATIAACIVLTSLYAITERTGISFVRWWIEWFPKNMSMFWIYVAVVCLRCIITGIESQFYHSMVIPQCVIELHQQLLNTMLRAPFAVLDAVDSEVLFYRMLSDGTTVSRQGAMVLKGTVYGFSMISNDAVLIAHGVPSLLYIFPVMIAAMYWVRTFYFQAVQELRDMANTAKSNIQVNTKEVSTGLEHIRAMGWQDMYLQRGFTLLDDSQRVANAGFQLRSWLTTYIYLITSVMMIFATISAVLLKGRTSPAGVGSAFLIGLWSASELKSFFRQYSRLDEAVSATANVRAFITESPRESDNVMANVTRTWPERGEIVLESVNATYRSSDVSYTALSNVTIAIRPGQKLGIIGRTGSGKSTLLLTLLNMLDYEGSVLIDDMEISRISKKVLRSRITTIPQHPIKLPGTIRDNLLPWDLQKGQKSIPDHEISLLLSELGLREYIEECGGLDAQAETVKLSQGQKQLLAIGRAVLHQRVHDTKIVLMDEVTSSLDDETSAQVLVILHRAFRDCTTVIVAHRTQTLVDVDLVAEFSNGRLSFPTLRSARL